METATKTVNDVESVALTLLSKACATHPVLAEWVEHVITDRSFTEDLDDFVPTRVDAAWCHTYGYHVPGVGLEDAINDHKACPVKETTRYQRLCTGSTYLLALAVLMHRLGQNGDLVRSIVRFHAATVDDALACGADE